MATVADGHVPPGDAADALGRVPPGQLGPVGQLFGGLGIGSRGADLGLDRRPAPGEIVIAPLQLSRDLFEELPRARLEPRLRDRGLNHHQRGAAQQGAPGVLDGGVHRPAVAPQRLDQRLGEQGIALGRHAMAAMAGRQRLQFSARAFAVARCAGDERDALHQVAR